MWWICQEVVDNSNWVKLQQKYISYQLKLLERAWGKFPLTANQVSTNAYRVFGNTYVKVSLSYFISDSILNIFASPSPHPIPPLPLHGFAPIHPMNLQIPFWIIWNHFGPFWTILDHFDLFWSFLTIFDHFYFIF